MPPPPAVTAAVAAFARRVVFAGFLQGAARAAVAVAAAYVVTVVAVRVAGGDVATSPWWAFAAVPVLAAGVVGARASRLPRGSAAAHLDQRLQLAGLLLTAHDGPLPDEWQRTLAPRLAGWRAALPAIAWQRLGWQPLAALALVVVLMLWPARPPAVVAAAPGALAGIVQSLRDRLLEAGTQGQIPADVLGELGTKLASIAGSALDGDASAWRELDELAQRIGREELLARLADQEPGQPGPAAADAQRQALQQAFAGLQQFVRDGQLPAMAKQLLEGAMRESADLDPQQLLQNVERLRELASRIGGDAGDLASQLARFGVERRDLDRLRGLARQLGRSAASRAAGSRGQGDGDQPAQGAREGGERGGSAGVGSAPAALRFVDPAAAGANAGPELALPSGTATPREWVPAQPQAGEPVAAPTTSAATGASAPAGVGGATWQLQVAPRHRAVVQRFFAAEPGKDKR